MKAPTGWDIPIEIRSRLGERSGQQRSLVADGHVVMVLHKSPSPRTHHREGAYFWRLPSDEWRASQKGRPRAILQELIDEYQVVVDQLARQHEDAASALEIFAVLERIGPVNRAARNLADTLIKSRDGLETPAGKQDLQDFCDHANDIARACELLQMDARNALDFHIARQSEIQAAHSREMERSGHKLNTMATMFLPLTAVASVFGMNLRSGLEESPPWMFWLVLFGSMAIGLFVSEAMVALKQRKSSR
jgi:Mg2+ and Co2+ transporter CorA